MLELLNSIALLCQFHPTNMELVKYQEQCQVRLLSCYEDATVNQKSESANDKGLILARCIKITKERN